MKQFIRTKLREFLNESTNNSYLIKKIADSVSDKLYCDRNGSCVHFAEEFVLEVYSINAELLSEFFAIEGYVDCKIGDVIPQQHTWIELTNGEKIDPTFKQFTKYGWANYCKKNK